MPRAATGSPCAALSPLNPSLEPPEGEKRPCGALRAKWGEWPRGKPSREPAHGKGNPRRAAAQAGNPRKHGRIGAQRPAGPPAGAGRPPFLFPLGAATSPRELRKAQEGPARHSGSRSPPNHMPGWSWRPAAGSATEGTRPSQPVRAGRTKTRRALQPAAPGARTAPIMKGRGPPVRPANRPFDRRLGENRPGPSGTPQAAAVLTDARKTTKPPRSRTPDAGQKGATGP